MNVAESVHECNQHEQCWEVDCEVLTINNRVPTLSVESTSAMMILTLALVMPEREVFECVRGDSMETSLGKI